MKREQAIEIACRHAAAEGRAYYSEGFQPHEWVVSAIMEAGDQLAQAQTRFVNLVLDLQRLVEGEEPLNGFEEVKALREMLRGAEPITIFTPAEILANPRLYIEPQKWERRADGAVVPKDRWEVGFRNIVTILVGARTEFEIDEIVDKVRALAGAEDQ